MIKFSQFQITIYKVQTKHHESLYLDHLPYAIKEKYKDTEGMSDIEKELFVDTSLSWELGEIDMVGYVGLFHLWEKYTKDFISRVFNKKCSEWPRLARTSYPQKVFTHLDSIGIDISSSIRCGIEEANSVVNAYKHGEEAIEKLQNTLPEYFCVTGRVESFCIPEGNLEKLFNTVHGFWDEVEAHIEPDFNWKP